MEYKFETVYKPVTHNFTEDCFVLYAELESARRKVQDGVDLAFTAEEGPTDLQSFLVDVWKI